MIVVEFVSNTINSILQTIFKNKEHITFNCFDVSSQYLVVGTSSGGTIVFHREPFYFIKLISSPHGTISKVKISPNEKHIAIGYCCGLVKILENFFEEFKVNQSYTFRSKSEITALAWFENTLYFGDLNGNVLEMIFVISKVHFQVMLKWRAVDEVIQLDLIDRTHLLVSTDTSTIMLNLDNIPAELIGKRLGPGFYGCCVVHTNDTTKIYYARPKARLWEVDNTSVVKYTIDYNECLKKTTPMEVLFLPGGANARLGIKECHINPNWKFNFELLYNLSDRFIVTFYESCVFVFDVETNDLIFWSNMSIWIQEIAVVDSLIYIWDRTREMKVLSVVSIEQTIRKTLSAGQYTLCADVCLHFKNDLLKMMEQSSLQMDLWKQLEIKLPNMEELAPIFDKFREESLKLLPDVTENKTDNKFEDADTVNAIIMKQCEVTRKPYYKNVEMTDFSDLCKACTLDDLKVKLQQFLKFVDGPNKQLYTSYCSRYFTNEFIRRKTDPEKLSKELRKYLLQCVAQTEILDNQCKKCLFPLPNVRLVKIRHHDLLEKLYELQPDSLDYLTQKQPYFFKYKLLQIKDFTLSDVALLVQYHDPEVIRKCSSRFSYDTWEHVLVNNAKLLNYTCLNCGGDISQKSNITWTILGELMIEAFGALNTLNIFEKHTDIVNGLESTFYLKCISSVAINKQKTSLLAADKILSKSSERTKIELAQSMEILLQEKYKAMSKKVVDSHKEFTRHSPLRSDVPSGCSCYYPSNAPVINGAEASNLNRGHTTHIISKKSDYLMCQLCKKRILSPKQSTIGSYFNN